MRPGAFSEPPSEAPAWVWQALQSPLVCSLFMALTRVPVLSITRAL